MSSSVRKRDRIKREPRNSLEDFDEKELLAIEACRKQFGSPVVVFGSRARGNWAEDSDIDIGVEGYSYQLHKSFAENLSKVVGIKVDLNRAVAALTHNGAVSV